MNTRIHLHTSCDYTSCDYTSCDYTSCDYTSSVCGFLPFPPWAHWVPASRVPWRPPLSTVRMSLLMTLLFFATLMAVALASSSTVKFRPCSSGPAAERRERRCGRGHRRLPNVRQTVRSSRRWASSPSACPAVTLVDAVTLVVLLSGQENKTNRSFQLVR